MVALFGTASNPAAFYAAGFKASVDMPAWLAAQGLTAYEYSCTRGVNIKKDTAERIADKAREYGIKMSVHAPYYINLATLDENILLKTEAHIIQSVQAAKWLGADRVVIHVGSPGKQERKVAFERIKKALFDVLDKLAALGLNGVQLATETMGKINQIGSLDEILELCSMSDMLIPTVDFGHLHAVSLGKYTTEDEYKAVFEAVAKAKNDEVAKNLHVHFSRIEYSQGGEKKHWTFMDDYGPDHRPFLNVVAKNGYTPRIICESNGTQAQDASIMREYYLSRLSAGIPKIDVE